MKNFKVSRMGEVLLVSSNLGVISNTIYNDGGVSINEESISKLIKKHTKKIKNGDIINLDDYEIICTEEAGRRIDLTTIAITAISIILVFALAVANMKMFLDQLLG